MTQLVNLLSVDVSNPLIVELCPLLFLGSGLVLNLNQTVVVTPACTVTMVNYHTNEFVLVRLGLTIGR